MAIEGRRIDDRMGPGDLAGPTGPEKTHTLSDQDGVAPLFPDDVRSELRSRWEAIQTDFVDEPRHSVEQADRLVAETTERLAGSFAEVRRQLEDEWNRGDDVSTEDLRRALRRYRSFFGRLVST